MGGRLRGYPAVRGLGGLLSALLFAGVLTAVPAAAVAPTSVALKAGSAASGGGSVAGTEDAALAEARRTGKDVEVTAERTETGEVFAKPNGRLEALEHLRPVRTRVNGEWRDIDTSLRKRADGSVTPEAASVGIAFSGGGGAPLIALERAGRELSLSWPTALPTPVIDGSTATYPSVLPDVDLKVRADVDGVSHTLVVKTPQAAANPQLAELRLGMHTDGMTVQETTDGGLRAMDTGAGGPVFEAPQPLMWDSSTAEGTSVSRKAASAKLDASGGPGEAAQVAPLDVEVTSSGDELVLTPDQQLLKDATYPVYIDPQWYSPKASNWTMVSRYWASSSQWHFNGDSDAGAGYCAGDARCAPEDVKRLFYSIPTEKFAGKAILDATFVAHETHSYSCVKTDVELWRTQGVNKSTTWNSQLASGFWADLQQTRREAKGYSSDCSSGDVEFWALRAVQQAASFGWSTTTFGLRAKSETDPEAWKRFSDDAYLRVQYNKPPAQIKMSQLTQNPGGTCSSTVRRVRILPTLRADNVTDPDGDSVAVQFQGSWDAGDGKGRIARWTSAKSTSKKSGSDFSLAMPASIPRDKAVGWHARSYDGAQWSPWSFEGSATDCAVLYDTSVPPQPSVTSGEYPASVAEDPDDPWADGVGRYGTFTIDTTQTDVTKYWFGVNAQPSSAHTLNTSGGGAKTITFMPTKSGVNFITAQAFDAAGNGSSIATYYFRVRAGQPERVAWDLDENAGANTVSGQGGAWPADLSGGAKTGGEGVVGTGLHLDGKDGQAATVSPVLNTAKSFSVSLWAKLPGTDQGRSLVAAAQSGNHNSGFELYYSSALGGWNFLRHSADVESGAAAARATQPACAAGDTACTTARLGQWTHLVGVFDNTQGQLKLYVDGKLVATTAFTSPWDARRSLHLGATSLNGTSSNYFAGDLDEAQLFDYQLSDAQVAELHDKKPVATGRPAKAVWSLDEDGSVPSVAGHAQKISAGLHGGALLGGAGASGTSLNLNGTDGYASTGRPVLDTFQSFSVSLWARLPKDKEDRAMTVLTQGSKTQSGFELYHSSSLGGWVFMRAGGDSTDAPLARATYPVCPEHSNCAAGGLGEWAHVVGVYDLDAGQIRLYVNGFLRSTQPFTTPWLATGPVMLGAAPYATGTGGFFKGDVDDARMYDRVLSDEEVKNLFYQHPVVKGRWRLDSATGSPAVSPDDSSGNRPLTLGGQASIDISGSSNYVGPGGLVLDGISGFAAATLPSLRTSESFTAAAWVSTAARPDHPVAVMSQPGVSESAFIVRYVPDPKDPANAGTWQLQMPDKDAPDASRPVAEHSNFQNTTNWNHLAVVYDAFASEMRLYVDGELQAVVCSDDDGDGTQNEPVCTGHLSWNSNVPSAFDAAGGLQLGRVKVAGRWGEFWPGVIDDVWAVQGALTETQIRNLASGNELPTNPGP
ncbi:LamG domain-containing protein [Streptomyces sp. NPDC006923]|uniref:LamG domain-containing protein n=1 Tax=Streptomyces sp. NPDC006923 TaxID=3155355 RepID=UPI003409A98D